MASSRVGHRPQALFMSPSPASTSRTSSSVSFKNRQGRGISVSMCAITAPQPKEKAAAAKVDRWMRESVADIIKNLREAPLLFHLYPTPVVEKDVREETWRSMVERWGRQESPVPVGVIFVERLPVEDEEEEAARAWGVVVQGAGGECGPVCYLLKTTSGGGGPGHRCTHFCLMRVQNYRESALSQLSNCWLLR